MRSVCLKKKNFLGILMIVLSFWKQEEARANSPFFDEKKFYLGLATGLSKVENLNIGPHFGLDSHYAPVQNLLAGLYLDADWSSKNKGRYRFLSYGAQVFYPLDAIYTGIFVGARLGLTKVTSPQKKGGDTDLGLGPLLGFLYELSPQWAILSKASLSWIFDQKTYYLIGLRVGLFYRF